MTTLAPAPTENLDELLDGEVVCICGKAPATHLCAHRPCGCDVPLCDKHAPLAARAIEDARRGLVNLECTLCGVANLDPKTTHLRPI